MKTKLHKNLIFLFGIISIFISVMLFNFAVDPYKVFRNKQYMDIYYMPRKYINVMLKAYKDVPCDTVLLGGSNLTTMFDAEYFYKYFFNKICLQVFSYEEQYNLLKDYLSLHPETKNVFIFLCYPIFWDENEKEIPKLQGKNFNLKELRFLLLSEEAIGKSIDTVKSGNFKLWEENKKDKRLLTEKSSFVFNYFPYSIPFIKADKSSYQKSIESNLDYYKKILLLLNEKKINYRIVIPPHHAIYQAMIFNFPYLQAAINDFKRVSAELSYNDVYDFSIINGYTTTDLKNNNFFYVDVVHPNLVMGVKIFKILKGENSENGLYLKLNKKNIEQQLNYEDKMLAKYFKQNQSLILDCVNFYDENSDIDTSFYIRKFFDNAPECATKEIIWLKQKIKKLNNMIKREKEIKQGVWDNEI